MNVATIAVATSLRPSVDPYIKVGMVRVTSQAATCLEPVPELVTHGIVQPMHLRFVENHYGNG